MPDLLAGVVAEIASSFNATRLTVPGIAEWICAERKDLVTAEVLCKCPESIRDVHGDEPCVFAPGCDHEVGALAEYLHRETWAYIHARGGSFVTGRRRVNRGSSAHLAQGSALSWPEFSRTTALAVQVLFREIMATDAYGKLSSRKFTERSGSNHFEKALKSVVKKSRQDLLEKLNAELGRRVSPAAGVPFLVAADNVAMKSRNSSRSGVASSKECVADADLTLDVTFEFPSIGFKESHRLPINLKAVLAGTQEIQCGAGSMVAWTLASQDGAKVSGEHFLQALASAGGVEMTDGVFTDYFFAVFDKSNLQAKPLVASLLTLDPEMGALPHNRHRDFPGFGLHVPRARGALSVKASVVDARHRLISHIGNGAVKALVQQAERLAAIDALTANTYSNDIKKIQSVCSKMNFGANQLDLS